MVWICERIVSSFVILAEPAQMSLCLSVRLLFLHDTHMVDEEAELGAGTSCQHQFTNHMASEFISSIFSAEMPCCSPFSAILRTFDFNADLPATNHAMRTGAPRPMLTMWVSPTATLATKCHGKSADLGSTIRQISLDLSKKQGFRQNTEHGHSSTAPTAVRSFA